MFKKLKKILLVFVIAFVVIFFTAFILVSLKARSFIVTQLEHSLNKKVSLKRVSLTLPLTLIFYDLKIENFLSAKSISVSANVFGLVTGKIILNNITFIEASLKLERTQDGLFNLPRQKTEGNVKFTILPLSLKIENSELIFEDKKLSTPNTIKINNLNVDIHKSGLNPFELLFHFNLKGTAPTSQGKGLIASEGWVNWSKKDMDGVFSIKDLDCKLIIPYIGNFFSPEKLKEAKVNINSQLKAKNNDLVVNMHLELENLAKVALAEQLEKREGIGSIITGTILDILKDETDKAAIDFTYKAKLDKPFERPTLTTSIPDIIGGIIQKKDGQPPIDKFKKIGKDFEDIGKRFKEKFKELEENK